MNILSRYTPRSIRSLVYMLQASEYDADAFLRWNLRVKDLRHVEKRGHLTYTGKAILLSVFAWFLVVLFLLIIVVGLLPSSGDIPHFIAVWFILFIPLLLPYLLASFTRLINLIQKPVEAYVVNRARRKLAAHTAFKVAIAGSYGKTTMREIVKTVLAQGKRVATPGGSENTPLGIARFIQGLDGTEEVLIFELGEYYPGDVRRLCDLVQPDLGIVTGVNEAHMEKFRSLERTADTVFELADFLGGKPLYVNGENGAARARTRIGALLYSREGVETPTGGWRVSYPRTGLDGTSFTFEHDGVRIEAHSALLGIHQIGPLLAAAHIAVRLGLTDPQIAAGIAAVKPFAHRLEKREWQGGVIFLDDSYNGNPDGARAVIEFLSSLDGHRRFYVTPGLVEMGDRSESVHREIGRTLAERGIEQIVLIRTSVTPWIEEGLKEGNFIGELQWFDDMPQALEALRHATVGGDIVLVQNDWPDQYA